jgi:hypothetical protein
VHFAETTVTHSIPQLTPEDDLPRISEVNKPMNGVSVPTLANTVNRREREFFVENNLPSRIRAMLDQPFGKENLEQCFSAEPCLRHVLLPLVKSTYLDQANWTALQVAYRPASTLASLLKEYTSIDFRPLQGYPKSWKNNEIDQNRVRMATSALLHFEGDAAALVRWIGGPHTGAHRDVPATIKYLEGKINPSTLADLERIFLHGIPSQCNASATEANFQVYLAYGNHNSVDEDKEKTYKSLLKDHSRGYCLAFDERILHFVLNCHITPGGLVNLDHQFKPVRPIFDSSFRPQHWCHGINDWTSKTSEPAIQFADSFMKFLTWIYNLRITYPNREIYPIDDDVSGAFRHAKYHPNVVAMHSYLRSGYLAMATGGTFGDNTTPGNWEAIALGRQQLAQFLWKDPETLNTADPFMPKLTVSPAPSATVVALFTPADADAYNQGVLDEAGNRRPPQYDHHVDDNLYADVEEHVHQTVASSMLSLFNILGQPTDNRVPNPFSEEKFENELTHTRKTVGYHIDTRRLTIGLLPYKRTRAIELLASWLQQKDFNLLEIAALHGVLESLTRFNRWGRSWFFALQNALRHELNRRYYIVKRIYEKKDNGEVLKHQLPTNLHHRIQSIIAQEKAKLLWNSRYRMTLTNNVSVCLQVIHDYLVDETRAWEESIGFIIKRQPHAITIGDASKLGGGAHCDNLEYWFDLIWSPTVRHGVTNLKSTDLGFVHINCLEFIVVIIQLAAVIVRLRTLSSEQCARFFPNGIPAQPVCQCLTDNIASMAWVNKVTTKSLQGQNLIGIYAEILHHSNIGVNSEHIRGILNTRADDISRPISPNLSLAVRHEQIFLKHNCLRTWDFFLPNPELLQLLYSALFTKPSPVPPKVPKNLGRFVPVGFTILSSPQV